LLELFGGSVWQSENVQQFVADFRVGDFVFGGDVVDLAYDAFVEYGVERVYNVARVDVSSRRRTVAMD
jgi:hypothetical protein